MKTLDKISTRIITMMPDNLLNVYTGNTDEPVMFIPREGNYVEILGHRIDGDFKSFEGFCEYLNKIKQTEIENDILKAEKALLETYYEQIKSYLDLKITEASFERIYENGMIIRSMREELYQNVLDEINKIMENKDEK